jgi:hypothetical protein
MLVFVHMSFYPVYMAAVAGISETPLLGAVMHAVGDVTAVRTGASASSDRELLDALAGMTGLQRQVNGTVSLLMAVVEKRGAALRTTNTPFESVLAASGQESVRHVRNQVFHALMLASRPRVQEAAAAGQITLGQARAIRDLVEELPPVLSERQRNQAEGFLLRAADGLPAEKLRGLADAVLDEVAPQERDTPEQRQLKLELRDKRARARRCLRFGPPQDGSMEFRGSLPVLEGARLKGLVESIAARSYRAAKDVADRSVLAATLDQRLADALLQVAAAAESGEGAEGSEGSNAIPAGPVQITVLMREEDLLDRAGAAGLLSDGTQVTASELRRLACGAGIVPVVLGSMSEILDLGRSRRLASPALRRAVGLRDGHCAFPGCEVPLNRCDLHHVRPWQSGGRTSLGNLVALCVRHHQLCEPAPPEVDGDGYARPPDQWRIFMGPGGIPQFVPPKAYEATVCARSVGVGAGPGAGPGAGTEVPKLYALSLFDDHEPPAHCTTRVSSPPQPSKAADPRPAEGFPLG